VTAEGKPLRKRRYVFSETFAAIAMSEYALATGDQHWAKRAIQVFEDTQRFLATPGFLPAKFEADVKLQGHSIVMILINVGSCIRKVVDDPKLTQQIDESIEKLKKYFIHPEFKCLLETVGESYCARRQLLSARECAPCRARSEDWCMGYRLDGISVPKDWSHRRTRGVLRDYRERCS
jgi:mannose/cellobiose epimerase-like protein (N-acyl-D-glucosamine 2-epimerase family)